MRTFLRCLISISLLTNSQYLLAQSRGKSPTSGEMILLTFRHWSDVIQAVEKFGSTQDRLFIYDFIKDQKLKPEDKTGIEQTAEGINFGGERIEINDIHLTYKSRKFTWDLNSSFRDNFDRLKNGRPTQGAYLFSPINVAYAQELDGHTTSSEMKGIVAKGMLRLVGMFGVAAVVLAAVQGALVYFIPACAAGPVAALCAIVNVAACFYLWSSYLQKKDLDEKERFRRIRENTTFSCDDSGVNISTKDNSIPPMQVPVTAARNEMVKPARSRMPGTSASQQTVRLSVGQAMEAIRQSPSCAKLFAERDPYPGKGGDAKSTN